MAAEKSNNKNCSKGREEGGEQGGGDRRRSRIMRVKCRFRGRAGRERRHGWRQGSVVVVVVVDMHHFDDETLSTGAVGVGAADEVEETRTIKVKRAVSIVKRCDGIAGVAVVETPFVYFHHRVLVVHKRCIH